MSKIKYPFGPADTVTTDTFASTMNVDVDNQKTFWKLPTMTGACTLTVATDDEVQAGAELIIEALSDTTARTITFGTGFEGASLSGTISKANTIYCVYDGSAWQVQSARLLS